MINYNIINLYIYIYKITIYNLLFNYNNRSYIIFFQQNQHAKMAFRNIIRNAILPSGNLLVL